MCRAGLIWKCISHDLRPQISPNESVISKISEKGSFCTNLKGRNDLKPTAHLLQSISLEKVTFLVIFDLFCWDQLKSCWDIRKIMRIDMNHSLFAISRVILRHFCVILRYFCVKLHKKCPFVEDTRRCPEILNYALAWVIYNIGQTTMYFTCSLTLDFQIHKFRLPPRGTSNPGEHLRWSFLRK